MPTYYRSTERKPGRGIRKSYRHGGRNRRDEEARVIGVQDNAADELRRVRRRRPKDASEVRDRRAQLARVGSRERNARDEMRRLRGYQMGGGINRLPRPMTGFSSMAQQRLQGGQGGFQNQFGPPQGFISGPAQSGQIGSPQQFRPPRPSSSPARVSQQIAAAEAASRRRFPQSQISTMPSAAGIQRGAGPRPWLPSTQRPEYLPDQQRQQFVPWARGGRVGLKKGGRIPRKKGAKFI